jgi:hypothetical protein
MLLTAPQQDLGVVMNEFMKSVSRTSNYLSGRSGHVFGGPYHWSLVNSSRYFGHALKYVYRNPVKAKLCEKVEDYAFGTLQGLLGVRPLPFPVYFTRLGLEMALPAMESYSQLNWLNTPFPNEAEVLIKKGLRKKVFDTIKDRKTRQSLELLSYLI